MPRFANPRQLLPNQPLNPSPDQRSRFPRPRHAGARYSYFFVRSIKSRRRQVPVATSSPDAGLSGAEAKSSAPTELYRAGKKECSLSLIDPDTAKPVKPFRIILLALVLALLPSLLSAQPKGRPRPQFTDPQELDAAEGARYMEAFRESRISGTFCFVFELKHMPRRAESIYCYGKWWGDYRVPSQPANRMMICPPVELGGCLSLVWARTPPDHNCRAPDAPAAASRMYYHYEGSDQPALPLAPEQYLQPVLGNLVFTPFHLEMPFLDWEEYEYEGPTRTKGRKAHQFLLYPPDDDNRFASIGAVRVILDAAFKALLAAEVLSPAEEPEILQRFQANSFKKAFDRWFVKEFDLLDYQTRDKTRFTVEAVAFDYDLPDWIFTEERLPERVQVIPQDAFQYLQ